MKQQIQRLRGKWCMLRHPQPTRVSTLLRQQAMLSEEKLLTFFSFCSHALAVPQRWTSMSFGTLPSRGHPAGHARKQDASSALGCVAWLRWLLVGGSVGVGIAFQCWGPTGVVRTQNTHFAAGEDERIRVVNGEPCAVFFDDPAVSNAIFCHITQEYRDLGTVERDEVALTVAPHVFAQEGDLTIEGIRMMNAAWATLWLNQEATVKETQVNNPSVCPSPSPSTVLCDVGSGVGNVCLQTIAESPYCRGVVGVEVLPSRHRTACHALELAQAHFPRVFGSSTSVIKNPNKTPRFVAFHNTNLVSMSSILATHEVGVLFSHSWMFDDDLMQRFACIIEEQPTLWCIISARPFLVNEEPLLGDAWRLAQTLKLRAEWRDDCPFFVYIKNGRREDVGSREERIA